MRKLVTIGLTAVVCSGPAANVANSSALASGRLVGKTLISFGCPGPATEPPCNPWRPFAHARFSLARRSADGRLVSGTLRTVTSDAAGRFSFRARVGRYLITPLPQQHTHGGERVVISVRAGESTTAVVRFVGFPQMALP